MSRARLLASIPLVALLTTAAQAEVTQLPDTTYDAFLIISLANTAKQTCAGATVDDDALGVAMYGALAEIAQAGLDPTEAVQHIGSATGMAELQKRETALRSRHGVAPEGAEALCAAIRAEAAISPTLAAMVTMP